MENFNIRFYDEFDHLMSACVSNAADEIAAIRDAATETKTRLSVVGRIEITRLDQARENVELLGEDTAPAPAAWRFCERFKQHHARGECSLRNGY